ncbi:hypothetical protein ACVI1T_004835 [Rhizobium redzepovicii]
MSRRSKLNVTSGAVFTHRRRPAHRPSWNSPIERGRLSLHRLERRKVGSAIGCLADPTRSSRSPARFADDRCAPLKTMFGTVSVLESGHRLRPRTSSPESDVPSCQVRITPSSNASRSHVRKAPAWSCLIPFERKEGANGAPRSHRSTAPGPCSSRALEGWLQPNGGGQSTDVLDLGVLVIGIGRLMAAVDPDLALDAQVIGSHQVVAEG